MADGDSRGKKRRGGSAAKYDQGKRQQHLEGQPTFDPRRTKLHVNDPRSLRNYAMLVATYNGNEGSATVEMHRLFSEHLERVYGAEDAAAPAAAVAAPTAMSTSGKAALAVVATGITESNADDVGSAPLTASDLLKQELAELGADSDEMVAGGGCDDGKGAKGTGGGRRFGAPKPPSAAKLVTVRTACKGVVMLRIGQPYGSGSSSPASASGDAAGAAPAAGSDDKTGEDGARVASGVPAVDPLRVVRSIFDHIEASGQAVSRHMIRCVPLQRTCFAGPDEIAEALLPLLQPLLGPTARPTSFNVALKRRNNEGFNKDAMVSRIVDMVRGLKQQHAAANGESAVQGARHAVKLKGAEVCIVVEINQALAGLAIVGGGDYESTCEFNLAKFQAKHVSREAAARDSAVEEISETADGGRVSSDAGKN